MGTSINAAFCIVNFASKVPGEVGGVCIQGFCKVTIEFSKVVTDFEKVQYSLHFVQGVPDQTMLV